LQEDNLKTLLKAANIQCESYWPALFAKALTAGDGIEKLLVTPGGGGGGGGGGKLTLCFCFPHKHPESLSQ